MIRADLSSWAVAAGAVLVTGAMMHAPQSPAQSAREDAYRANNVGVALLEQFNYEDAAGSFRKALSLSGDLDIARLNLAIALLYGGKASEAFTTAQAVATKLPDLAQAHYVVGLAARAQGDTETALAAFRRVLQIDATDAGSRINIGQIDLTERRFAEATRLFQEAVSAEPFNATAAYGLAMALTRSGAAEEGRSAMQRFETLREAPYAVTYSQTYLEQGRYGEAIVSTGAEADLVETSPPAVTYADATAAMLAPPGAVTDPTAAASMPGGSATLFDADADGDLDLFATSSGGAGQRFYRNEGSRFTDVTERAGLSSKPGASARAAVAGDFDNDGRPDLLLMLAGGSRLMRSNQEGRYEDVTAAAGLTGSADVSVSAAFVDVDHDGDLDIFAPNRLLRNNGKGTFTDITSAARVAEGAAQAIAVVPTDFDNRRDIDLVVLTAANAPRLFKNMRDGSFRDVASEVGLPAQGSFAALAASDVNKDGFTDFFFGRRDAAGLWALSNGQGRFTTTEGPQATAGARVAQFVDYDNDGLLDLFVAAQTGARLFRNLGSKWSEVTDRARLDALSSNLPGPIHAVTFGDVDRDGDTDAVILLATGALRVWRNDGASARRSLLVTLAGRVSNRLGVGSKVEMRAGSLRQRIEVSSATPAVAPADLLFGLGARASADVVRVIWPSGTLQAETAGENRAATVTELDRKPSSCPYLYTWNGTRFEFVTDFMGGGEIGYWMGPGVWNTPDPDEYVRIPPGHLVARDGRYELRVTNELEEAVFIDRVQLVAVDHGDDWDVYPNEGLGAPVRRGVVTTTRGARPLAAATDEHGHDVLPRLLAIDRQYPDDFRLLDIRGYAEPHELRLDLGRPPTSAVLLATAWTDYAFSSDNVAAHQRGLRLSPPALEVRDTSGGWRPLVDNIGIPVGRPQTIVVDLQGKLRPGEHEVRIVTNMRIYWDQILVDTSGGAGVTRMTALDPGVADLRWRGFSAEVTPDGRQPYTYDYARVSSRSPWKTMVGRYTREGDVRELLGKIDDMFVISRPGDELRLSFDASRLPPLEPGQRRTFLFFSHGYSKEMDIGSATPYAVEPLPFRGMRQYPYGGDEEYPASAVYREYRDKYNTRVVSRSLPPIETSGMK
jgi:Flp pilus assembly protein TadD